MRTALLALASCLVASTAMADEVVLLTPYPEGSALQQALRASMLPRADIDEVRPATATGIPGVAHPSGAALVRMMWAPNVVVEAPAWPLLHAYPPSVVVAASATELGVLIQEASLLTAPGQAPGASGPTPPASFLDAAQATALQLARALDRKGLALVGLHDLGGLRAYSTARVERPSDLQGKTFCVRPGDHVGGALAVRYGRPERWVPGVPDSCEVVFATALEAEALDLPSRYPHVLDRTSRRQHGVLVAPAPWWEGVEDRRPVPADFQGHYSAAGGGTQGLDEQAFARIAPRLTVTVPSEAARREWETAESSIRAAVRGLGAWAGAFIEAWEAELGLAPVTTAAVSMAAGWLHYGQDWGTIEARRVGDTIHVDGLAKNRGGSWTIIASLPEGWRPESRLVFQANRHTAGSRVDVVETGAVTYVAGAGTEPWQSLGGIAFPVSFEPLPLAEGFSRYRPGNYRPPGMALQGDVVRLTGLVAGAATRGAVIARLPPSHRPAQESRFGVNQHDRMAQVVVHTDGRVIVVDGDPARGWLSLDGIVFTRSQAAWEPLALQGPHEVAPSSPPVLTRSGREVVLEGRMAGRVGELVLLPAGARPAKTLVFHQPLVHHGAPAGSAARIEVRSDGRVSWIVGDEGWVSLAGISFVAE